MAPIIGGPSYYDPIIIEDDDEEENAADSIFYEGDTNPLRAESWTNVSANEVSAYAKAAVEYNRLNVLQYIMVDTLRLDIDSAARSCMHST